MKILPSIMLMALIAVLAGCAKNPVEVAGGSSDHGNAITGTVLNANGTPSASAMVRLFESHYIPLPGNESVIPETTFTGPDGAFQFEKLPEGVYNVVAMDTLSVHIAVVTGLAVTGSEPTVAGTSALKKPGRFEGTVYDTRGRKKLDSVYLYIEGLPFYALTDTNAFFSLTLPEGAHRLTAQVTHHALFRDTTLNGPLVDIISENAIQVAEVLFPISTQPETLSYAGYALTFGDEFNDTLLDWQSSTSPGGKWGTYYQGWGLRTNAGNGEQQVLMDPEFNGTGTAPLGINPFEVSNGSLKITCDTTPQALKPYLWDRPYTSGMISSERTFCQLYGLFEIRCKMAQGAGLRSVFYLMPCAGTWPPGMSVADIYGQMPDTLFNEVLMTDTTQSLVFRKDAFTGADGFHTYALQWLPDQMIWYVDGVVAHRAYRIVNEPMYVWAALNAGSYRQNAPDPTAGFPAKMEIDYIRAYSK